MWIVSTPMIDIDCVNNPIAYQRRRLAEFYKRYKVAIAIQDFLELTFQRCQKLIKNTLDFGGSVIRKRYRIMIGQDSQLTLPVSVPEENLKRNWVRRGYEIAMFTTKIIMLIIMVLAISVWPSVIMDIGRSASIVSASTPLEIQDRDTMPEQVSTLVSTRQSLSPYSLFQCTSSPR